MSVIRECMGKYDWDHDRRVGMPDRRTSPRTGNEEENKPMANEVLVDVPSRAQANNLHCTDRREPHIHPIRIRRAAA
jgi:hypothetical protein